MIYLGATWKPVSNHGGAMTAHLGLILHVQEGNGSLAGWFDNPASKVSATWWVSKTGAVEQYVDADAQAWAQAAGNPTYNSVETEGYTYEALTPEQVTALAELYVWGVGQYGWHLTNIGTPGDNGFGWHGMGGVAWGNHPGCPGSLRRGQMPSILAAANEIIMGSRTTEEGNDVFMYLRASGPFKGYAILVSGGKQVPLTPTHANLFVPENVPYANVQDTAMDTRYDLAYGPPVGT